MPKKQTTKKSQTRHRNRRRNQPKIGQIFVLIMFFCGSIAGGLQALDAPTPRVLAYATNVSQGGLLSYTNQNRGANGLGSLTLNGALNSAAQAKANDMAAKDYWSHTSPDGRQPWDFISAAGYSYSMAGENLAYGALTSAETVQAWMDSPGHRANILKTEFREVGFGFANAANYQSSGQHTVIVAMYAKPYAVAPTPAPVKPQPVPVPAKQSVAAPVPIKPQPTMPSAATRPVEKTALKPKSPASNQSPVAQPVKPDKKVADAMQSTQATRSGVNSVTPADEAQSIKRVELVTGNYTGLAVGIVVVLGAIAGGVFLYRHSRAWHRRIIRGEEFIVKHPLIDALAVMMVVIVVVLMQNVGQIL